ncbi:MAG TPA: heme ABC exporter ATP-binding protein CcmA [Vicinamibacteria bacterium]
MSAVVASGLYRRYGRRFALVDVSFEAPPGACVMLAGRNGSGKSTLLRVLSTLLRPDRGQLRLLGLDARAEADEVRRRTALLGHRTFFYEPLTALENLALWARLLGRGDATPDLSARLAEVGLQERAHDPVSGFSAGMRQRLALARVLLKDAEVVLLDEPYGHLDPPGFRLVDGLLERLRGQGRTVLMATHLLARGREHCDQALLLDSGRLLFSGAAAELPEGALGDGPAEGAH